MRCIRYLNLLFFVLVLAFSLVSPAQSFYIKPYLNNITPDGATIMWETDVETDGSIDYGPKGRFSETIREPQPAKIHKVRITGLQADTVYSYHVRTGPDADFEGSFKTAPASERPIAFAVIGDSRRWSGRWQETEMGRHMMQWSPEFVLNMGDLVNSGHKYELWPEHFARFNGLISRTMMLTVRGNHEGSRTTDVENDWFGKYHELPGAGEPFVSFDWGNTHFVAVTMDYIAKCLEELDKDLAQNSKKYTVVTFHPPVYCAGYFGPTDNRKEDSRSFEDLRRILDKYNVTVHFSGHTHIYERSWPIREGKRDDRNGTLYIVQGGDINGNFPEWWTAFADDRTRFSQPTYTMVWCQDDRFETRTYAWSKEQSAILEIDHTITWKDEAIPAGVLSSLAAKSGTELLAAIDDLGAMMYAPALEPLLAYLDNSDDAVRRAAAGAIRAIGSPAGAEAMLAHVTDSDAGVAVQAARAIEAAMPDRLAPDVAKLAVDSAVAPESRVALIGALQLRAPGGEAKKAVLDILRSDAPEAVRERAAYAITRLADESDVRGLTELVENETHEYVLTRLAYTLNEITGVRVGLDDKHPLAQSQPGARKEFVAQWLGKK